VSLCDHCGLGGEIFEIIPGGIIMGMVDVWEVESCTEFEAARGRSPRARITARHRGASSGERILPAEGLHRFCDLDRFPRFIHSGEGRKRFTLYQVQGLDGMADGFYGVGAPGADVKVIFNRWFGGSS
jgi:hypothetical protein